MRTNQKHCSRALALSLLLAPSVGAQGTRADYQRAERFLSPSADTLVSSVAGRPHWLAQTDRFWYRRDLPHARQYLLVDPARATKVPAFDHARLGEALGRALLRPLRGDSLPIDSLVFGARGDSLTIVMRDTVVRCGLTDYRCAASRADSIPEGRSTDGRWVAFVRDFNLFVRSTETRTERPPTALEITHMPRAW